MDARPEPQLAAALRLHGGGLPVALANLDATALRALCDRHAMSPDRYVRHAAQALASRYGAIVRADDRGRLGLVFAGNPNRPPSQSPFWL